MTYKTKEKSFFEAVVAKEKEEIHEIEEKSAKKVLKWYDFGASKLRLEIKRHPAQYFFLFISTFLGSVITSSFALFGGAGNVLAIFINPKIPTTTTVKSAQVKVVPTQKYDHLLLASKLRKQDKDFVLIDIRNEKDFKAAHILTAQNVPVYNTAIITKDGDLDAEALQIAFKPYMLDNKLIIVYGQNAYSTLPQDIATLLSLSGKKVKALAVGWEEWLHLEGR